MSNIWITETRAFYGEPAFVISSSIATCAQQTCDLHAVDATRLQE